MLLAHSIELKKKKTQNYQCITFKFIESYSSILCVKSKRKSDKNKTNINLIESFYFGMSDTNQFTGLKGSVCLYNTVYNAVDGTKPIWLK